MKFLVFLGSARKSTPPRPARLGERVAKACIRQLHQGGHSAELIDSLNYQLDAVLKQHFAYAKAQAPSDLESLALKIESA